MSDLELKPINFEFMECETCRAKPGTPLLCSGCLHNRTVIATLREDCKTMRTYTDWLTAKLTEAENKVLHLKGELGERDDDWYEDDRRGEE